MPSSAYRIYSADFRTDLAARLAIILNANLGQLRLCRFPDGEQAVVVKDEVTGTRCVVVSTFGDSDAFIRTGLIADALRGAGARSVLGCFPLFPYARQNEREKGEPLSAQLMARWLEAAGYDPIITLDIHSPVICRFCEQTTLVNVMPASALADALRRHGLASPAGVLIVATDAGGAARARMLATELGCAMSCFSKSRLPAGQIMMQGGPTRDECAGKTCILVDDIAATGQTLFAAAARLGDAGAHSIHVAVTHVVLPTFPDLLAARLPGARLFVCNGVHGLKQSERVVVVDIAPLLGDAIAAALKGAS
jgi:ribose-phosphate pyrophosphokinase